MTAILAEPVRGRPRMGAGLVFFLALSIRLLVVLAATGRVPPAADGTFYDIVARRIAEGQGYTWLWPDGVVTPAAHYPIGYPALLGIAYRWFGEAPGVAFALNALLGAAAAPLAYELGLSAAEDADHHSPRRIALLSGAMVALLPSLWLYTPALMTEGPILTLLLLGGVLASRLARPKIPSKSRDFLLSAGLGVTIGLATLFRPQSIVFAPLFAIFLARNWPWTRRLGLAGCALGVALLVVAPWTARNCRKMDRCTFVSANGGWNLLIGTFPEGKGGFSAIEGEKVPPECRTVFAEVAKDQCFGRAGARRIADEPLSWLSLVPAKLRVTFDFTGAAAEYLHRAGAANDTQRLLLGGLEIITQRILFLLALFGLAVDLPRRGQRALLVLSAVCFLGAGAYGGHLCLLAAIFANGARVPPHQRLLALTLGATVVIHAIFFGAGRYSLPVLPFFAPLAALGSSALVARLFDRERVHSG